MSTPSSVASPVGVPKAFGRSTGVLRPQRTLMRYTLDTLERRYCSAVHLSKAQRWIAAGFLLGTGVLAAAITGDAGGSVAPFGLLIPVALVVFAIISLDAVDVEAANLDVDVPRRSAAVACLLRFFCEPHVQSSSLTAFAVLVAYFCWVFTSAMPRCWAPLGRDKFCLTTPSIRLQILPLVALAGSRTRMFLLVPITCILFLLGVVVIAGTVSAASADDLVGQVDVSKDPRFRWYIGIHLAGAYLGVLVATIVVAGVLEWTRRLAFERGLRAAVLERTLANVSGSTSRTRALGVPACCQPLAQTLLSTAESLVGPGASRVVNVFNGTELPALWLGVPGVRDMVTAKDLGRHRAALAFEKLTLRTIEPALAAHRLVVVSTSMLDGVVAVPDLVSWQPGPFALKEACIRCSKAAVAAIAAFRAMTNDGSRLAALEQQCAGSGATAFRAKLQAGISVGTAVVDVSVMADARHMTVVASGTATASARDVGHLANGNCVAVTNAVAKLVRYDFRLRSHMRVGDGGAVHILDGAKPHPDTPSALNLSSTTSLPAGPTLSPMTAAAVSFPQTPVAPLPHGDDADDDGDADSNDDEAGRGLVPQPHFEHVHDPPAATSPGACGRSWCTSRPASDADVRTSESPAREQEMTSAAAAEAEDDESPFAGLLVNGALSTAAARAWTVLVNPPRVAGARRFRRGDPLPDDAASPPPINAVPPPPLKPQTMLPPAEEMEQAPWFLGGGFLVPKVQSAAQGYLFKHRGRPSVAVASGVGTAASLVLMVTGVLGSRDVAYARGISLLVTLLLYTVAFGIAFAPQREAATAAAAWAMLCLGIPTIFFATTWMSGSDIASGGYGRGLADVAVAVGLAVMVPLMSLDAVLRRRPFLVAWFVALLVGCVVPPFLQAKEMYALETTLRALVGVIVLPGATLAQRFADSELFESTKTLRFVHEQAHDSKRQVVGAIAAALPTFVVGSVRAGLDGLKKNASPADVAAVVDSFERYCSDMACLCLRLHVPAGVGGKSVGTRAEAAVVRELTAFVATNSAGADADADVTWRRQGRLYVVACNFSQGRSKGTRWHDALKQLAVTVQAAVHAVPGATASGVGVRGGFASGPGMIATVPVTSRSWGVEIAGSAFGRAAQLCAEAGARELCIAVVGLDERAQARPSQRVPLMPSSSSDEDAATA